MKVSDQIVLRAWRSDDSVAQLTELLHTAYAPLAQMGFRYSASNQEESATRRRLQMGFPIVAELNNEVVGTATLYPPSPESPCEWYRRAGVYRFGQFAIRPDLQHTGIGLLILRHLEALARERSASQLALDTAEGAAHLRNWYERRGFRVVDHVQWEDTNYRSAVLSKDIFVSA